MLKRGRRPMTPSFPLCLAYFLSALSPIYSILKSIRPVHRCTALREGWIEFECQRRASGYKKQQVLFSEGIMVLNRAQLHSSIYSMLMLWINTSRAAEGDRSCRAIFYPQDIHQRE